jgi:membrane-associated protease RseP (regulator of RpoE activity)
MTVDVTPAAVSGRSGSYLGIQDTNVFRRYNPIRSVTYAGSMFGQVLTGSAKEIGSLPSAIPHLFAKNRASTSAGQVTSVVGAGEITGSVVSANVGWQVKVDYVLLIMASLNIFVGAFNLVPLLPLDGGHIAVVIFERVRAWFARLHGRPDPGLVDMTKLVPVSVGVFAILVFFGVILILADLVNPIRLTLRRTAPRGPGPGPGGLGPVRVVSGRVRVASGWVDGARTTREGSVTQASGKTGVPSVVASWS